MYLDNYPLIISIFLSPHSTLTQTSENLWINSAWCNFSRIFPHGGLQTKNYFERVTVTFVLRQAFYKILI